VSWVYFLEIKWIHTTSLRTRISFQMIAAYTCCACRHEALMAFHLMPCAIWPWCVCRTLSVLVHVLWNTSDLVFVNKQHSGKFMPEFIFVLHIRGSVCSVFDYSSLTSFIHSFSILSADRSKASSKTIPPHSAIQSFLLQMRISSPVFKVIQ
jgi:hypothetical protein